MSQLTFSVDLEDVVAYNVLFQRTSSWATRIRRKQQGVLWACVLLLAVVAAWGTSWNPVVLAIVGFGVVAGAFANFRRSADLGRYVEKSIRALYADPAMQSTLGAKSCRIEGDLLIQVSPILETRVLLSSLHRIRSTGKHLFLQMNPVNAIIVPRATVTEGDFEAFRDELATRCPGIFDATETESVAPVAADAGNPYSSPRP